MLDDNVELSSARTIAEPNGSNAVQWRMQEVSQKWEAQPLVPNSDVRRRHFKIRIHSQSQHFQATQTTSTMTMEIDRPSIEERNQRYKPGSIKRVKLKNFLTYDDVEFFPGPR